jgi:cell division transport system ATP-binding protein
MIRFDRVSKRYAGGCQALSELSFEIDASEMLFLTGHSGAGKSTLLRLIGLLERPSRGSILMQGTNLSKVRKRGVPFVRRQVGMIFQDHRLLHDRTVFDNVAMPLVIAGVRRGELGRRVRAALDKVNLLDKERMFPLTLSGGEQQRVGIARAIVARPPVVLADEPTGNLDPGLSAGIMQLFAQLNETGMCVIIASHDLELVRRMNRRVLVLENGRLIDDFRPDQPREAAS